MPATSTEDRAPAELGSAPRPAAAGTPPLPPTPEPAASTTDRNACQDPTAGSTRDRASGLGWGGRAGPPSVRPPCLSSPRQPGQQRSDKATCQSHKIKCFLVFKIAFTEKQLCEPSSCRTDPASTVQRRGGCRRQVACARADTGDSQGGLLSPAVPPDPGVLCPALPRPRRGVGVPGPSPPPQSTFRLSPGGSTNAAPLCRRGQRAGQ